MNTMGINEGIQDFVIILANVGYFMSIFHFKYNHKNIMLLLSELKDFNEFGYPPNIKLVIKRINQFTQGFAIFGMAGYFNHFLYNMFLEEDCAEMNLKYNKNDICGLSSHLWLPFKIDFNVKLLIHILQFLYIVLVSITCMIIAFVVSCAELITVRVSHLNYMFRALSSTNYRNSEKGLIKCIKYHVHIILLTERYNQCFDKFVMLCLILTGPIIAVGSFSIMTEPKITVIIHILGWVVTLFIICISGQRLINESLMIPQAVYDTEWFEIDIYLRKYLILILMQSQTPLKVKMWMFSEASYMTFAKVMKMTYSLLTLLNGTLTNTN